MKRLSKLMFFLLLSALSSQAQDVHFSQYFTSPMTLNPANTGLVNRNFRVAANYRQQWAAVTSNPYETYSLSFDGTLMKNRFGNGDALGYGILLLNDQAGVGQLTNSTLGLSLAYHHAFGRNKDQYISLGVQTYLVNKSIDFQKLIFGSQWDPASGTVIDGGSGEIFNNNREGYTDFNTGAMYSGKVGKNATMYSGLSFYHVTRPNETFLNSPNKIHSRVAGYLGGSFEVTDYIVTYGSAMYQQQGPQSEFMIGGAAGFVMNPHHDFDNTDNVFYLGAWYRYGDAIIPYIGLDFSQFTFGLTYDATISTLANASSGTGAYELSMIYNGFYPQATKREQYNFSCPKF